MKNESIAGLNSTMILLVLTAFGPLKGGSQRKFRIKNEKKKTEVKG